MNDNSPQKTVDVVLTAFNAAEFIEDSILSILGQSLQPRKIIVIDDCSLDETSAIVNRLSAQHREIILFRNERNIGCGLSRTLGLQESTADYIALQDADDLSMPFRLRNQYDFLEARPEIDVVGTAWRVFESKERRVIKTYTPPVHHEQILHGLSTLGGVSIHSPTTMIRRRRFVDLNLYFRSEAGIAEDKDLWLRATEKGLRLANIRSVDFAYRQHSNQVSFSRAEEQLWFQHLVIAAARSRINHGFDIIERSHPMTIDWLQSQENSDLGVSISLRLGQLSKVLDSPTYVDKRSLEVRRIYGTPAAIRAAPITRTSVRPIVKEIIKNSNGLRWSSAHTVFNWGLRHPIQFLKLLVSLKVL